MDDHLMTRDEALTVIKNSPRSGDIYHLRLERAIPSKEALPEPGQFAMVRVREGASPFLRRPFSYFSADESGVEFLYRTVGVGTRIMAKAKPGDVLKVLGPLGVGFDVSQAKSRAVLVAGGMGLPPLRHLAQKLAETQIKSIDLIHGAATADDLNIDLNIKSEKITLRFSTEDGSAGYKGMAGELLDKLLEESPKPDVIYACGPNPMLKRISDIAGRIGVPCKVSVESMMACGMGVCLGCAIQTAEEHYLHVCADGPVFDSKILFRRD